MGISVALLHEILSHSGWYRKPRLGQASISIPVLITAMGGHIFIRDSEIHYEMSASKDKDFITIEGATHGGTPCKPCETTPGQYSNTVKNFFDYVAKWMNARY